MLFVVNKPETLQFSISILFQRGRNNWTKFGKQFLELFVSSFGVDVFHIKVSVMCLSLFQLRVTFLSGQVRSNINFLTVQQHTIQSINSFLGSTFFFEVNKPKTLGFSVFVGGNLAGQDVTKHRESVIQSLVVNIRVQVLDKDVTRTLLSQ